MTALVLAALGGVLAGLAPALLFSRTLRKGITEARLRSVTRLLFVTTQLAAICWVSCSYLIAAYATVRLGQAFPVVDLSKQAITTILGVNILKVLENLFEHNNGGIFGKSNAKSNDNPGSDM